MKKILKFTFIVSFVFFLLSLHVSAYPRVILTDIQTDNTPVISGETFTLSYSIKNTSSTQDLFNMIITFDPVEGIYPGEGISSTQYISNIGYGGSYEGSIQLRVDESLLGGIYPISANLEYEDIDGTTYNTSTSFSVVVQQPTVLDLTEVRFPAGFRTQNSLRISLKYTNSGSALIRGLTFFIDGEIEGAPIQISEGDVEVGYTGAAMADLVLIDPNLEELELKVMYENTSGVLITERVMQLQVDSKQVDSTETDDYDDASVNNYNTQSDIPKESDDGTPSFDVELFVVVVLLFAFIIAIIINYFKNKHSNI